MARRNFAQTPEEAHAAAMEAGCDCKSCPLWGCGRGPVMPETRQRALFILGEAPGQTEVTRKRSFVGQNGKVLIDALYEVGVDRDDVSISNAILCRPERDDYKRMMALFNREGKKSPLDCCLPRLKNEISQAQPNTILALGSTALEATAGALGIPFGNARVSAGSARLAVVSKQHGHPLVLPDVTVCASYHPAAALRSKIFLKPVAEAIKRAVDISRRGGAPRWSWPEAVIGPSYEEAMECLNFLSKQSKICFDLESTGITNYDKITCAGLGCFMPDGSFFEATIPLRKRAGSHDSFWTSAQDAAIREALRKIFDKDQITLVGQNIINFDLPALYRENLISTRRRLNAVDTLILHHNTKWSEHRHNLGFMAALLYDVERWKDDADAKVFVGVDDITDHKYNAKDVIVTACLERDLPAHVKAAQMEVTCAKDHKLAYIARDMRDLGLMYDMDKRFDMYLKLREKKARHLAAFHCFSGNEKLNPNSVPQLRDWLYGKLKLTPPFTTEGRPFDPEEDDDNEASTGEAAIMQLLKDGMAPKVDRALNELLRFRAVTKLISTYVQLEELTDKAKFREASREGRQMYDLNGLIVAETAGSFAEIEDAHGYGMGLIVVVHPNFKVHVVPSGRFAASEPNVLSWPVPMRMMICAPPGYELVAADMEQVEARIFAQVSEDEKTIDFIISGEDIHLYTWAAFTSERVNEKEIFDLYLEMKRRGGKKIPELAAGRQISKTLRYAISYGSEEEGLWQQMSTARDEFFRLLFPNVKRSDVHKYFERWHEIYPSTRIYYSKLYHDFVKYGYITSLLHGRKRWLMGGWSQTEAANFPMQSTAGDMMNDAIIEVDELCPHRGWGPMAGLNLQKHDELMLQVPINRTLDAQNVLRKCMTKQIGVMPYPVEVKNPAKYWGEIH